MSAETNDAEFCKNCRWWHARNESCPECGSQPPTIARTSKERSPTYRADLIRRLWEAQCYSCSEEMKRVMAEAAQELESFPSETTGNPYSRRDVDRYRFLRAPHEHFQVLVEDQNEDGYTGVFYQLSRLDLDRAIDAELDGKSPEKATACICGQGDKPARQHFSECPVSPLYEASEKTDEPLAQIQASAAEGKRILRQRGKELCRELSDPTSSPKGECVYCQSINVLNAQGICAACVDSIASPRTGES
jgi:hypothetical protein